MIIELFGPPGVGKTTFARALAGRLREAGHVAELILSIRPAERMPVIEHKPALAERLGNSVIHRVSRPAAELLTIARHPFANMRDIKVAVNLIRALPPKGILQSIKRSQYIMRLSHFWFEKHDVGHIVLFDQAFVQTVCALALVSGRVDDTFIESALNYTPKSDVVIRLEAPLECLEARLHERRQLQSASEQLFEFDWKTIADSNAILERLHGLLLRRGRAVLCASSVDQRSLEGSLGMVEKRIIELLRSKRPSKEERLSQEGQIGEVAPTYGHGNGRPASR